jgi:PHD/YefM family antitoxin component YafN of YafNO toxin-antitoxin module
MMTVGIEDAKKDLNRIVGETILNNDETVIVSDKGSVVLLEEREYENLKVIDVSSFRGHYE